MGVQHSESGLLQIMPHCQSLPDCEDQSPRRVLVYFTWSGCVCSRELHSSRAGAPGRTVWWGGQASTCCPTPQGWALPRGSRCWCPGGWSPCWCPGGQSPCWCPGGHSHSWSPGRGGSPCWCPGGEGHPVGALGAITLLVPWGSRCWCLEGVTLLVPWAGGSRCWCHSVGWAAAPNYHQWSCSS